MDMKKVEKIIEDTNDKEVDKVEYAIEIRRLLTKLEKDYGYNSLDSMLVLKDILYHEWKDNK